MMFTKTMTTLATIVAATQAMEINKENLFTVDYSPYRDGQSPNINVHPTRDQVFEDIKILKDYTKAVRLYGSNPESLFKNILDACKEYGIKVHANAYLSRNSEPAGLEANKIGVQNLIKYANDENYKNVIETLIVGNEPLLEEKVTKDELVGYINEVKTATSTTGLNVTTCLCNAGFLDENIVSAVDHICVHGYAYWTAMGHPFGGLIAQKHNGVKYMIEYINDTINQWKSYNKKFVLAETGWATQGGDTEMNRFSIQSEDNQLYFWNAMLEEFVPRAGEVDIYMFSAFDENWKNNEETIGGSWGMWNVDRTPKKVIAELFSKGTTPNEVSTNLLANPEFERSDETGFWNTSSPTNVFNYNNDNGVKSMKLKMKTEYPFTAFNGNFIALEQGKQYKVTMMFRSTIDISMNIEITRSTFTQSELPEFPEFQSSLPLDSSAISYMNEHISLTANEKQLFEHTFNAMDNDLHTILKMKLPKGMPNQAIFIESALVEKL